MIFEADGLSLARAYQDVSLQVHAGEVLGIYGFMGCGQVPLARTLFGKIKPDRGTLRVDGHSVAVRSTAAPAGRASPSCRKAGAPCCSTMEPVYKNMSISILDRISAIFLKPTTERRFAREHVARLQIRPPRVDIQLGSLSGGNQQKVGLAKWLTFPPKVLILSEPTRGMDVGAKDDVVKIVRSLRQQGMAVIVISTEPETVLSLADRILIMKKGEIVHEFANETVSKDRLLEAA